MRERGLVQAAICEAAAIARRSGASRVARLTFALVPGGSVSRRDVLVWFDEASPGTPVEGAKLEILWAPLRRYCVTCGLGYRSAVQDRCPCCGEDGLPEDDPVDVRLVGVEPGR